MFPFESKSFHLFSQQEKMIASYSCFGEHSQLTRTFVSVASNWFLWIPCAWFSSIGWCRICTCATADLETSSTVFATLSILPIRTPSSVNWKANVAWKENEITSNLLDLWSNQMLFISYKWTFSSEFVV